MQTSILYSSIRAIFITISTMIGIALGLIPIMIVLAFPFSSQDELKVEDNYKPEIVGNAQGVRKKLSSDVPVILKVNISGMIGLDELTTTAILDQLAESREGSLKGDRVKALLVYLNTPGGTVSDSNGIYRAIKNYKKRHNVPVYGYVDGLCASGGMYIASACDKVYASDISVLGSIGVMSSPIFNVSQLMEKIGVESLTLTAGKGKDALNPFRPWKEGEQKNYKAVIEYLYGHFVDLVAESRPEVDKELLIQEIGATIFSAQKALELGLIDDADSSLQDTIAALTEKLGFEEDKYQVVEMESKLWYHSLFKSCSPLFTGKVEHKITGFPEHSAEFRNQFLYLYCPE